MLPFNSVTEKTNEVRRSLKAPRTRIDDLPTTSTEFVELPPEELRLVVGGIGGVYVTGGRYWDVLV